MQTLLFQAPTHFGGYLTESSHLSSIAEYFAVRLHVSGFTHSPLFPSTVPHSCWNTIHTGFSCDSEFVTQPGGPQKCIFSARVEALSWGPLRPIYGEGCISGQRVSTVLIFIWETEKTHVWKPTMSLIKGDFGRYRGLGPSFKKSETKRQKNMILETVKASHPYRWAAFLRHVPFLSPWGKEPVSVFEKQT